MVHDAASGGRIGNTFPDDSAAATGNCNGDEKGSSGAIGSPGPPFLLQQLNWQIAQD